MRFLILTQYYPPEIGGAPTRLRSVAENLLRLGHEVEVVTARPNYPRGAFFDGDGAPFYRREVRDGVVVHRVWVYPAVGGGLRRILNYATFALTSIPGLLRARKPDYLFVESPPLLACIPAYLTGMFWRVPYIFCVSDLWPDAVIEGGFIRPGLIHRILLALESWAYKRAGYVSAVTQGIREALIARKGVPADKVLFLPNGADTLHFQPRQPDVSLKHQLGLDGKWIVLWAGTLGYAQGLEHVLQAAEILRSHPEIHFLFLGDGSARKELEALKRDRKLDNLTFKDPVPIDDLPPYYSIAGCGLASLRPMPAHEGARPSKIFPVLASARPLIFVGTGECARLVESAQAGIVVPPGSPDALARDILRLFADPQLANQCGQNGRGFVETQLDWSTLVEGWVKYLRRPAASTAGASRISATS